MSKPSKLKLETSAPPLSHTNEWYIPSTTNSSKLFADMPSPSYRTASPKRTKSKRPPTSDRPDITAKWIGLKLNSSSTNNLSVASRGADRARSGPQMSHLEIDIFRQIVVREKLLAELKTLIQNQADVSTCILEIVELVKAIRFQTLDIVELINSWINSQPNMRPFLYRGTNYMIKLHDDLEFLDDHEEIVARFCFEFKSNPLAYRGGGEVARDALEKKGFAAKTKSTSSATKSYKANLINDEVIDGISTSRLRAAEISIQRELDRRSIKNTHDSTVDKSRRPSTSSSSPPPLLFQEIKSAVRYVSDDHTVIPDPTPDHDPNLDIHDPITLAPLGIDFDPNDSKGNPLRGPVDPLRDPFKYPSKDHLQEIDIPSARIQNADIPLCPPSDTGKSPKPNPNMNRSPGAHIKHQSTKSPSSVCRMKNRTAQLEGEAEELRTIEDKITFKVDDCVARYKIIADKKALLEGKRRDALLVNKEVSAQKLVLEIITSAAEMSDLNQKIKDLRQDGYFVTLDRVRKDNLIQKLLQETIIEKKRKKADLRALAAWRGKGDGCLKMTSKPSKSRLSSLSHDKDNEKDYDKGGGGGEGGGGQINSLDSSIQIDIEAIDSNSSNSSTTINNIRNNSNTDSNRNNDDSTPGATKNNPRTDSKPPLTLIPLPHIRQYEAFLGTALAYDVYDMGGINGSVVGTGGVGEESGCVREFTSAESFFDDYDGNLSGKSGGSSRNSRSSNNSGKDRDDEAEIECGGEGGEVEEVVGEALLGEKKEEKEVREDEESEGDVQDIMEDTVYYSVLDDIGEDIDITLARNHSIDTPAIDTLDIESNDIHNSSPSPIPNSIPDSSAISRAVSVPIDHSSSRSAAGTAYSLARSLRKMMGKIT